MGSDPAAVDPKRAKECEPPVAVLVLRKRSRLRVGGRKPRRGQTLPPWRAFASVRHRHSATDGVFTTGGRFLETPIGVVIRFQIPFGEFV